MITRFAKVFSPPLDFTTNSRWKLTRFTCFSLVASAVVYHWRTKRKFCDSRGSVAIPKTISDLDPTRFNLTWIRNRMRFSDSCGKWEKQIINRILRYLNVRDAPAFSTYVANGNCFFSVRWRVSWRLVSQRNRWYAEN